jgi:amino acid adenylation domain-containing protein
LPILQLPTDHPHPEVQTYNGESQPFLISAELTQQLKTLAEANRVSLYTLLLSAYQILLYRYAGQDDIIIGSPVANRNSSKFASIVGHFVNMLPMRSKLAGEVSFTEHLRQTQQTVLEALDHQDFPFALMVERLQIQRDTRYSPIFQSTFVLQKSEHARLLFELEEGAIEDWQGLQLVPHGLPLNEGQFDLSLEMIELDSGLVGMLRYNKDLFKPDTVTRMLGHFQTLLVGITTYPQEQIDRLPLITATETQQLLVDWNDTSKDYPRHQCIHQLFETQVERTPNAIAIVLDNQQLTYQELNHQANSLAQYLLSLGVGPEILVGICVERSLEMVVGMLGILKAGGSYVPLDPAYPPERLAYMIEDSKLPFLLTEEFLSTQFSNQSVKLVLLDYDWHTIAQCATENPKSPVSVKNLAYTIYTSGSTGKPKGVQLCHASVVNFLYSMQEKPGLTPDDCLLAVTTISFDISVLELFLPLITGARVVLATQEIAADAIQLSTLLAQSGATVMQATPATWQMLIAGGWQGAHGLKILCGGEAISRELADQLLERGSCLWNMYGPTETTVWSAACPIDRERPIRVADPIANTQIYVLGGADPSRNGTASLLPIGVAGEVHIGGEGLARGYLNRPELTQERFIPDPFSHKVGARLYKTGDLACFRPDGSLEFLGRIDNQVKLRGYRIELGEIETALTQHPDVQQAVVIAREDNPGDKRLVSYLIAATTELPTTSDLRSFLQQRLPDYMIPSAFVQLETFPLTPNGKVDRRGFPKPDISAIQAPTAYIAPRNSTEQQMAEIWSKTLKLGQVGIQDDFFELGGHSLLATQVISQIRDSFAVNLSLRSLFEAPTIAGLCDRIEALRWASLQTPALEEDSADDYVEGVL